MASKNTLHTVFVTALEGGIGYWSQCSKYRWSKDGGTTEDLDGFFALVRECGDDDPDMSQPPLRIDREVVQRGITRFIEKEFDARQTGYRRIRGLCARLDRGGGAAEDALCEIDASDADCIVQMGLFNEVVYG